MHLATMGHNSTNPFNHGEVDIDDRGWVLGKDGERTPVEDFGMYILRPEPFPPSDSAELFQIFLDLLAAQARSSGPACHPRNSIT